MNVFVSPFNNPFINLTLEDHFLRGGTGLPLIFFYVNRPCVVLGRFQNPWLECNLNYLVQKDIWMVRRQSGGGCVFHDEGNLNYCIIYPDGMIDRRKGVLLLQRAFKNSGIDLEISPRHDLWLDNRKISGSAFKQIKHSSFHHGTFLVASNMENLEESLKHTIIAKESKSIPSVRSKVIKLQEKFPEVTIPDVIDLVAHELRTTPQSLDSQLLSFPEVQASFAQLISWEWLWGETPAFELEGGMRIHKGHVKGPVEGKFEKELVRHLFSEEDLSRFFPDFSVQGSGCLEVF